VPVVEIAAASARQFLPGSKGLLEHVALKDALRQANAFLGNRSEREEGNVRTKVDSPGGRGSRWRGGTG
jgi:hypothetical protein